MQLKRHVCDVAETTENNTATSPRFVGDLLKCRGDDVAVSEKVFLTGSCADFRRIKNYILQLSFIYRVILEKKVNFVNTLRERLHYVYGVFVDTCIQLVFTFKCPVLA